MIARMGVGPADMFDDVGGNEYDSGEGGGGGGEDKAAFRAQKRRAATTRRGHVRTCHVVGAPKEREVFAQTKFEELNVEVLHHLPQTS